MKRRTFIAALGGATVWSRLAGGQTKSKPRLIGLLSGQTVAGTAADISAFLDGLRDLGYVENKDFQVVYRYGEGHYDRMPLLAQELMQLKPDLVLAAGSSPAALAIKDHFVHSSYRIPNPLRRNRIGSGRKRCAPRRKRYRAFRISCRIASKAA